MTIKAAIEVHYDYWSTPDDDCYDSLQREAWWNGEWRFVGIVPVVDYTDGTASVRIEGGSLWGIDYGCPVTDADGAEQPYDHDAYLRNCAAGLWAEVPETFRSAVGDIDWSAAPLRFTF